MIMTIVVDGGDDEKLNDGGTNDYSDDNDDEGDANDHDYNNDGGEC